MSVVDILLSNSQMLKINWIKNKKIRKLIKEAKIAELELQKKKTKSQREDPKLEH